MKKRTKLPDQYEFLIDDAAMLFNYYIELRLSTQEDVARRLFAVDRNGKTQKLSRESVNKKIFKLKYNWLSRSPSRMEFLAGIYEDRIYEALLKKITRKEIRKCFAARRRLYQEYQISEAAGARA